MNPNLQRLHAFDRSLWVDNFTRKMHGDNTFHAASTSAPSPG